MSDLQPHKGGGSHEPGIRTITLLEINPRPTTSYVGLSVLLPPGMLARAWLDALRGRGSRIDLATFLHAGPQVSFLANGTIQRSAEEGV